MGTDELEKRRERFIVLVCTCTVKPVIMASCFFIMASCSFIMGTTTLLSFTITPCKVYTNIPSSCPLAGAIHSQTLDPQTQKQLNCVGPGMRLYTMG